MRKPSSDRPAIARALYLAGSLTLMIFMPVSAVNSVSVTNPTAHSTVPGFIDEAVAVVETHGSFGDVDLYLTYSDHGLALGPQVEIRHMFNLPPKSAVKDLWLWMGDSAIQARISPNWQAQQVYDQITAQKRDPALLQVKDGQYDLHVYPLIPGQSRKVRISMVIPMSWIGSRGSLSLPLPMLKAGNTALKLLKILVRSSDSAAGEPVLQEMPAEKFTRVPDVNGQSYFEALIPDMSETETLSLTAADAWKDGVYASSARIGAGAFLQVGVKSKDFFGLDIYQQPGRKVMAGLDLSGFYDGDPATLQPQLDALFETSFSSRDSVKLTAVGEGAMETLDGAKWIPADSNGIRSLLAKLGNGRIANLKNARKRPVILFADSMAYDCWGYPALNLRADVIIRKDIMSSLADFRRADIVAAYYHGYQTLDDVQAKAIRDSLDTFFQRGGSLLTYIDFNRGGEKIATHYIQGLLIPSLGFSPTILARRDGGVIGRAFPPTVYHHTTCPLENSDPAAVTEVSNSDGKPVVISKAIGAGRIVVTGIWSFLDGSGEKQITASPLLGLHTLSKTRQLPQLLASMARQHRASPATQFLIFSNSSGYPDSSAKPSAPSEFLDSLGSLHPKINTVNLSSDHSYQPAVRVQGAVKYYGEGMLLNGLSSSAAGTYFDLGTASWATLQTGLAPTLLPNAENFYVQVSADPDSTIMAREIFPGSGNADRPRFFMARLSQAGRYAIGVSAKFQGEDSTRSKSIEMQPRLDSNGFAGALDAIEGDGMVQESLLGHPGDTLTLMNISIAHRVLSDFTAFIAVEQNDSIRFTQNPTYDGNPTATKSIVVAKADSLGWQFDTDLSAGEIGLRIHVPGAGALEIQLLDLTGRMTMQFKTKESSQRDLYYSWNVHQGKGLAAFHGTLICLMKFYPKNASAGGLQIRVQRLTL